MPVYKDKERGTWYFQINYTDVNGNARSIKRRGFETKRAAKEAEYKRTLELNYKPDMDIPFHDLYNNYFIYTEPRVKYSSYYSKKNLGDLHILPFFKNKKVRYITTKDIISWQQEMLVKNYSYEYLSKIYTNLSAILQYGIKHHGIKENPCKLVGNFKNPEEIKCEINYWTFDEFKQFISVIDDDIEFYTFFSFLYYTGARKGETLALTWKDIDFDINEVNIYKGIQEKSKDGGRKIGPPKTKNSIRRILIPKELANHLKKYYERCKYFEGFNNECFVFGISKPFATTTIDRRFRKYIEKSGVKKIRIHDLRHSHASLLINSGANILVVSKRLGHKNTDETLNTYSHMFPNKEREIVNLIDNL